MKKRMFAVMACFLCLVCFTSCLRQSGMFGDVTDDSTAMIDTTPTDTTAPETEAPVVNTASFIGCGDNIIYYGTWRDAQSKSDGTRQYSFRHIYKNVEDIISDADIAFINQETVCSQSFPPESYPQFNSPVDLTYDIADVGFDVVCMANNHMLDKGALGLRESFDNWNDRGVHVIGCYEEVEDTSRYVTYYEENGITIAFVAYTEFTNLSQDPSSQGLWAPYLKQSDVVGDIREADENADFVIVSVHWGEEGHFEPSDLQKSYAKIMADSGADVILGHHPHVIQPVEWITGKDGNKTLCAYSLGNFVHEQASDFNVPGGMLSFNIVAEEGKDATAEDVEFIPTVCHYPQSFYNNTVYLLEDYTETLCSSHAVKTYYNNTISLDRLKKYVTDTISAEFLPDYLK